jgi:hypothetical protein
MFETVMYMGHPDVRHWIVLVALYEDPSAHSSIVAILSRALLIYHRMKTGHKVVLKRARSSWTHRIVYTMLTDD